MASTLVLRGRSNMAISIFPDTVSARTQDLGFWCEVEKTLSLETLGGKTRHCAKGSLKQVKVSKCKPINLMFWGFFISQFLLYFGELSPYSKKHVTNYHAITLIL